MSASFLPACSEAQPGQRAENTPGSVASSLPDASRHHTAANCPPHTTPAGVRNQKDDDAGRKAAAGNPHHCLHRQTPSSSNPTHMPLEARPSGGAEGWVPDQCRKETSMYTSQWHYDMAEPDPIDDEDQDGNDESSEDEE